MTQSLASAFPPIQDGGPIKSYDEAQFFVMGNRKQRCPSSDRVAILYWLSVERPIGHTQDAASERNPRGQNRRRADRGWIGRMDTGAAVRH